MQYHTVEIDNEVFEFVQNRAEPLVDDFNSALKKILGLSKSKTIQSNSPPAPKKMPEPFISSLLPRALSQILEVSHLVIKQGYSRKEATDLVARRLKVEKPTISDKYGRQMGLTVKEFDSLLSEPNLSKLKNKLYSKFPGYEKAINSTLFNETDRRAVVNTLQTQTGSAPSSAAKDVMDFAAAVGAKELPSELKVIFKRSNYFLLNKKFMVVKISRSEKPFWDVGKDKIDFLDNLYKEYYLVLLTSSSQGWIFTKSEINANIKSKKWNLREADNNYKINFPLPDKNSFFSTQNCLKKLGIQNESNVT